MLLIAVLGITALVVVRLALRVLHLALSVVLWLVVASVVLVPLHAFPRLPLP